MIGSKGREPIHDGAVRGPRARMVMAPLRRVGINGASDGCAQTRQSSDPGSAFRSVDPTDRQITTRIATAIKPPMGSATISATTTRSIAMPAKIPKHPRSRSTRSSLTREDASEG